MDYLRSDRTLLHRTLDVQQGLEAKQQVRELKGFRQTCVPAVIESDLTSLMFSVGRDNDDPGVGRCLAQVPQSKQVLAIR